MPWAEGAPSELPDALKRSNAAARVPLPVPLIVTHRAWRPPPPACIRRSSITPPLRGSRRSRAGRRRLMRWGGQPIPATLPPAHLHKPCGCPPRGGVAEAEPQAKADAVGGPTNTRHLAHQHIYTSPAVAPLEGESQKPSRRRRLMRWGGQPIPATLPPGEKYGPDEG